MRFRLGLAALVLTTTLGCLDEDPPFECPRLTPPTGGEIVGRWETLDVCLSRPPTTSESCPTLRGYIEGVTASGFIEFRADGSYQEDSRIAYGERIDFPHSCFADVAPTCRELGPIFAMRAKTASLTATVFCKGSDVCHCASRTEEVNQRTGTFRRDGARLVDEQNNQVDYTVVGDELRMQADGLFYRYVRL
jgi:hypothetical protein